MPTKTHSLIKKYNVAQNVPHNVRALPSISCRPGRWSIPDADYINFLETISSDLANDKIPLHFLEVPHNEYNQIKFDFDMRFKPTDEEIADISGIRKRCDDNFIKTIVMVIERHIQDFVEVSSDYNIYVQTKQKSRLDEKKIKEGIHIIIPEIVLNNEVLHALRNSLVEDDEVIELFEDVKNTEPIDKSIDKVIIDTNAWFIYGCGKPDDGNDVYVNTHIYKVSCVKARVSGSGNITKVHKLPTGDGKYSLDLIDNIKLFSNFGKLLTTDKFPYLDTIDVDGIRTDINSRQPDNTLTTDEKSEIRKAFYSSKNNLRKTSTLDEADILALLNCIKPEHIDDYHIWRRIGLSLFNMDNSVEQYRIWIKWSSQSPKFKEGECFRIWYTEFPTMGKYRVGVQTIKDIAACDNPIKYKEIINTQKNQFMTSWINAHLHEKWSKSGISEDTFALYIKSYILDYAPFKVVCCDPSGAGKWYKFTNHKWSVDKGATKIYMLLTETIKRDLLELYDKQEEERSRQLRNNAAMSSEGEEDDTVDEEFRYKKTVNKELYQMGRYFQDKCGNLLDYLSRNVNKDKTIKILSHSCYHGFEDFEPNLDENRMVFVCNNGVLDLEHGVFRKGELSDMSTMTCNIDFPMNVTDEKSVDIMIELQDYLDRIFPDQEIQNYVLNKIAEKLCGVQLREEFHICTGSGANGKSQFMKLIAKTFGYYYRPFDTTLLTSAPSDPNSASPAIAVLKSVRLTNASEPESGQPFKTDRLKLFISGDELTGRHLHESPIRFVPQYSMFLLCNDIPEMPATDDGVWRKVYVILFEAKFISKLEDMWKLRDPVRYPNHFEGVKQEHLYSSWAPYLLFLLFERYKKLKETNFVYNIPEKVKAATKKYQAESNIFNQFQADKIEMAPGYKISVANAFREFMSYAIEINYSGRVTKAQFQNQMDRIIGKPSKNYYIDIKINGNGEDASTTTNS